MTGVAVLVWVFSSKGVTDAILGAAFVYALLRRPRGSPVWRNAAGLAAVGVVLHALVTISWSRYPMLSLESWLRLAPVLGAAFAIPVLLDTREKIQGALLYTAGAITLVLTADLARLAIRLGPRLLAEARLTQPYVLNHPNVASIMAAAAFAILFLFVWKRRGSRLALAAGLAGMAVNAVYLVVLASRGPQVAFALMCASFGFLLPEGKPRRVWFAAAALAAFVAAAHVQRINPRFAEGNVSSLNERAKVWRHTWDLCRQRPVSGYGFGKKVFTEIYYTTNPPRASFTFPHPHQYWLKVLFESGWVGVALHAAAWGLLGLRLVLHLRRLRSFEERLLPGTVALLLVLLHVYGLADYPDSVAQTLQIWTVPAVLVLTYRPPEPRSAPATGGSA